MNTKPEVTRREIIAQTRIFRVEAMDLTFSNGQQRQYERIVGSDTGAVLVIGKPANDKVLLISEYAAGMDRYELAFPKGKIDPGEDMLTAANRELQEETGFAANKLTHIHSMTLAPGYLGHTTHIILAEDLYPCRLEGDEPEPIEVVEWSLADTSSLISHASFTEARSIASLFLAKELYEQSNFD